MSMSQMTAVLLILVPLLSQDERLLPCKMYVPYSITALLPYALTYLLQVIALVYGVLLNVSFDSLVYGLIIQTCGQIELLCRRLTESFQFRWKNDEENGEKRIEAIENFAIAEYVRHHILVHNIMQRIQSLFVWTIAILFFFSLVTLCTSIFQMSKKELFSAEFFGFILYLSSMMFQVFSYCWYGNELDLKNKSISYAIYTSNWMAISIKQRKKLLLVMMMSQKGRIISFYGTCALIVGSFTWIIKTSYSAFNLLQQTYIMDVLPLNFRVLWFCGAWSEVNDNNPLVRCLSFCYRYAIVILIYGFTILEVIELVRTRDHIEDLTEGLFLALTYVALCVKYGNFLARQNEMSMLLDCFRGETCQPKDSEEKMILIKYDRKVKWCVRAFMSLSQATCIALVLAPIVGPQNTDRPLPFKTYLPYSISGLYPYLATYLQHVGAIFYGVLLNVSFDSLVYGFTIHVCGQLELLCYRLSEIFKNYSDVKQCEIDSDKSAMISECVKHHLHVHEIVRRIQSLFVWTVTILFIFSMVTLCTSIFQMSKKRLLSVGFLSLILYLGSMLFQVFCYCWYGNELQLKSRNVADAIYSSNWTSATMRDRRSLLFVMIISQKGLKLSQYGIFSLALDTFTWILKTSYSAFNVLQQTSI
nr:PREDICTED: odorant receptor 46a, isoform B-like [Linepithema humile]